MNNLKLFALIIITLITASCSNPEDKYISLDCSFEGYKEELILNKKTMTWDAFSLRLASAQEGEKMRKVISNAKYREEGEHQYYLMTPPECPDCDHFLDRRTLTVTSPHGGDAIQCKKIDLPDYLRENQI
ncbi:MAG: hypothetical protein ACJ0FR_02500 [Gammaproteobacteria bacterium]|tara:strand:+ start:1013 stop:1402 length:390 start_codon:yes stop_codon:yes gene_type:complete